MNSIGASQPTQRPDPGSGKDPFAAALARYPVRTLSLDRIVDLLQVTHDPETIMVFREAMRRGVKFPPVSVVLFARRGYVADGHKRLTAYKVLSADPIIVEVWPWLHLAADLGRQLRRSSRRFLRVVLRAPWTQQGRREARRFVRDTAVHWRRMISSLVTRLRHHAGGSRASRGG